MARKLQYMTTVQLRIRTSGHCFASGHHVIQGSPRKPVRFEATWAEMVHPTEGVVLFDCGYTRRFHGATRSFPQSIYASLTKVTIREEEEARRQVDPDTVRHVLISHLHGDHVGGLRDFPKATCWTSNACLVLFDALPQWRSWARGVLKEMFPDDWRETCQTFESTSPVHHPELGRGHDVFGDGSVLVFPLPGHAKGQHGALVQTEDGPVFLAADAFWDIRAVTERKEPNPIVRVFFDDMKAYAETLERLRTFHTNHPTIPLLGTHCPVAAQRIVPFDSQP